MNRQMGLCRAILFAVEEQDNVTFSSELVGVVSSEAGQVGYNCQIFADPGLLICDDDPWGATVQRLTWEGHEFLDAARDEDRWSEAKTVAGKAKNWTFSTLSQILSAIATQCWQNAIN